MLSGPRYRKMETPRCPSSSWGALQTPRWGTPGCSHLASAVREQCFGRAGRML